MDAALQTSLENFATSDSNMLVLTGAGISAESGIPTFRGPEGYWTIGSKEYMPQDIGRISMFRQMPQEVWKWYLYRLGVCSEAKPNQGHTALVELEKLLGDRSALVTQNVDGLHLRAGSSSERTYQIHGNIDYMRCVEECSLEIYPMPSKIALQTKKQRPKEADWKKLRCPKCQSMTRPHLLWWDEYYNEEHYRASSALSLIEDTGLLIIVGTSGATNLPNQIAEGVLNNGGVIIDINIEKNTFSEMALSSGRGYFLQKSSSEALPEILDELRELRGT